VPYVYCENSKKKALDCSFKFFTYFLFYFISKKLSLHLEKRGKTHKIIELTINSYNNV
jgi:hypothetical protein